MNKFLFYTALAAVTLSSCSQNELIENTLENNKISFGTYNASFARATDTDKDNLSKFNVMAVFDGGVLFNEVATKQGDVFQTTETYYWPTSLDTDKPMNFYAVSTGAEGITLTKADDATAPSFEYTASTTADDQKDVVIATQEVTAKPADGKQPLAFSHALTKINFTLKGNTDKVKYHVTEIKIAAKTSGTYNFADNTWIAETDGEYTYFSGTKGSYDVNGTIGIKKDNNFMLIPQTGATVSVTYSVTKNDIEIATSTTKSFTVSDWGIGNNIRYTVTLTNDATPITFTATVNDWENESSETVIDKK